MYWIFRARFRKNKIHIVAVSVSILWGNVQRNGCNVCAMSNLAWQNPLFYVFETYIANPEHRFIVLSSPLDTCWLYTKRVITHVYLGNTSTLRSVDMPSNFMFTIHEHNDNRVCYVDMMLGVHV